ncbi:MAG: 3-phosphoshikimate 1-carboxyvinyltransferase [Schleiferilactobacillus perolens]|uniref:3-phosphoshikimate 1-carboxyvinyltransferase n=1 Tax=Schleiferilactobacillus perolens TaxID=100468 RepID=UPI0039E92352
MTYTIQGSIRLPGDKSIAHRALMIGAIAAGETTIDHLPDGGDIQTTIDVLAALGVNFEQTGTHMTVHGQGGFHWQTPTAPLALNNSGTTTRLLLGLLACPPSTILLTGDQSLSARPMERIAGPLRQMGTQIATTEGHLPIQIHPVANLHGAHIHLTVASAQVKSGILFAGLQADSETTVTGPVHTRDHTERLLAKAGANVVRQGLTVRIQPQTTPLQPLTIDLASDFSTAAFWIVLATLLPDSQLQLPSLSLNPTRTTLLDILARMGGDFQVVDFPRTDVAEPMGTLQVRQQSLQSTIVDATESARAIDELPLLALAATQAEGETVIQHIGELRVKESNRIAATETILQAAGAYIRQNGENWLITGPTPLNIPQHWPLIMPDHRMAMLQIATGLVAGAPVPTTVPNVVAVSYPELTYDLQKLVQFR